MLLHTYYAKNYASIIDSGLPQWLQYFKLVFLEIQNVPLRTVFANPVTYDIASYVAIGNNLVKLLRMNNIIVIMCLSF